MFRKSLKLYQYFNTSNNQKLFKPQLAYCQFLQTYCTNTALSIPTANQSLPQEIETEEKPKIKWTPIFQYEKIKIVSIISNLKIYQAIGGSISIVGFGIAEGLGYADSGDTLLLATMAAFSQLGIWAYSAFFYNLIGFVYVCPKIEKIRISYLDFWGKRKEVEIPISDLILPENREQLTIIPIRIKSSKSIFQLRVKSGDVLESYVFSHVFVAETDQSESSEKVIVKPLLRRRRPKYGSFR